nr:MAG TPA: hypothetical protein [Caudoviricetes sp.]
MRSLRPRLRITLRHAQDKITHPTTCVASVDALTHVPFNPTEGGEHQLSYRHRMVHYRQCSPPTPWIPTTINR